MLLIIGINDVNAKKLDLCKNNVRRKEGRN